MLAEQFDSMVRDADSIAIVAVTHDNEARYMVPDDCRNPVGLLGALSLCADAIKEQCED